MSGVRLRLLGHSSENKPFYPLLSRRSDEPVSLLNIRQGAQSQDFRRADGNQNPYNVGISIPRRTYAVEGSGSLEFSVEMKLTWDLRSDTFKGL